MEREDARKLSQETQEQLRKQAIRLRKKGETYERIGEIVGVHEDTVWKWCKKYEEEGIAALKAKKLGRPVGSGRRLSADQEIEIQNLISDKTPDQLKLSFALWTRQAVQELIKERYKIDYHVRTVGKLLSRWGFTPQKPLKQAYEQRPAEVSKWLNEEYPAIAKRASEEGAEIHWGDETGIRSDSQHGRSYAPRGKTPVIRLSAKRTSISMMSTVTNQGKVRFMVYHESMNAELLIKFMKRLVKGSDRKIYLILDNLRTHHSKKVKEWLKDKKEDIEVFYLPAYSPELNPDEYLNCDMKAGVHLKPPARNNEGLKKMLESHMRKLQKLPERVKKYFKHPKISYAL